MSIKIKLITLLFFILDNNARGESYPKGSLVFVVDITGSMERATDNVKSGVNAIFKTVSDSKETPVDNFILVTFGDPDVSDAMIMTNAEELISAIHIEKSKGGDCPEKSMTGIKTALEACLAGSFLYVFTDASAKDYDKLNEVAKIAQEKDSQVTFILTQETLCDGVTNSTVNDVYTDLAYMTSGQVFTLLDTKISVILKYIKDNIKSRKSILYTERNNRPGHHTLHYRTDSRTKDTTIALTGLYTNLTVFGPDGTEVDGDMLVKMNKIKILKLDDSDPGVHNVTYYSKMPSYIVVSAWSDVHFRHGFTKNVPLSFNDTVLKPFAGIENYITIKLYGKDVKLTSVLLLNPSYGTMAEIPLKILDKNQDLYITDPFNPPKFPMRVAINGIDEIEDTTITRFGLMLLESDGPDRDLHKNPTVKPGDENRIVEYKKPLKVNGVETGHSKPMVVSKDKEDKTISSATVSPRDAPYANNSVSKNKNGNIHSIHKVSARDKLRIKSKSIPVELKQRSITFLEKPKSITVDLNEKAVLHCKVDAYPPAEITWHYKERHNKYFPIQAVQVSADGSTLTIKHMQPSTSGAYVCVAKNIYEKKFKQAVLTISGVIPEINKTFTHVNVAEGESSTLQCSIIEGKPEPSIRWYRQTSMFPNVNFREMTKAINQTDVNLTHLNRYDTGIYTCRAQNIMGIDIHAINLSVEFPPEIKDDIKSVVVKNGDKIKNITCNVQGMPTPSVVWIKDGKPLGGEVHVYRYHSWNIDIADLHHTGNYTCIAQNKLGSAIRTVEIVVYTLHIAPSRRPIKAIHSQKRNTELKLKCPIIGIPEPKFKWIFSSLSSMVSPMTFLSTGSSYRITKLDDIHRGDYTCVASNIGGYLNFTHSVDVLFRPDIHMDTETFSAVEGDLLLKVHCKTTGNPKPKIDWWKDGARLTLDGNNYSAIDDWLFIKNVTKTMTEGKYKCDASNTVGKTSASFKVIVYEYPTDELIKNLTTIWVRENEKAEIKCYIEHKEVDVVRWYREEKLLPQNQLVLHKAKKTDSGVYTCRVNFNELSEKISANTKVIVGFAPMFITEEDRKMELPIGEPGYLKCVVSGDPKPKVTWWYNGVITRFSKTVYNFVMNTETVGKYICEVTNHFGRIHRTFELTLKVNS